MASNPSARVRTDNKHFPYALRVVQTSEGTVFWDREDTERNHRQFFISTSGKSARKLAQWILDNVKE